MGVGAVDAAHVGRGDDALRGEQSAEVHDVLHGIMLARFGDEWRDEVARRLLEDSGGLAGGVALGYEVVWTHAIVQWTSTRTFSFAIVLSTYLVALTLGSAWSARCVARLSDPWGWFGGLIVAAGLVALVEMALLGAWLTPLQVQAATWMFGLTGSETLAMSARFAIVALCVVFVPTLILGAAFPIALRLAALAAEEGA